MAHSDNLSGQISNEGENWEPTTLDSSWTQQATFCYGFIQVKRKSHDTMNLGA